MATKYKDIISIPKFGGINQSGDGYNTDMKYAQDGYGFSTVMGDLTPLLNPMALFVESMEYPETHYEMPICEEAELCTLDFIAKRWTKGQSGVIQSNIDVNCYAIAVADGYLYYRRTFERKNFGVSTPWIRILDDSGNAVRFLDGQGNSVSRFDTVTYELNMSPPVKFSTDIAAKVYSGDETWYCYNSEDYKYHELIADSATTCHYLKGDGTSVSVTTATVVRKAYTEAPVDCLLLANSKVGLFCVYAPLESNPDDTEEENPVLKFAQVYVKPEGDGTTIEETIKFGCIERYNDRIFGSGIDSDPDKIMYCSLGSDGTTGDVFNWEQNNDEPAMGAGDVQQPSWDGDKFVSLKTFSSSLLCIKKRSIWKISGSDPSEFTFKRMYGDGTIADGSVVTHGYYTYFLTEDGIKTFDGTGTSHLKYGWLHSLNAGYRLDDDDAAFAERFGDYYVIQPHSTETDDQQIILYNTAEGTFNIYKAHVYALRSFDGKLYGLIPYTIGSQTGMQLAELMPDCIGDGYGYSEVVWESAWIDLSAKNITKSSFEVYMMLDDANVEAYRSGDWTAPVVHAKVSVISEKKTKEKTVAFTIGKPKRIRINNSGRLYKLRIEVPRTWWDDELEDEMGQYSYWHMRAGIQMYLEYDYD